MVGASGLPNEIVDKLYVTLERHYIGKPAQDAIVKAGLEPGSEGPQEFATRLETEVARWMQIGATLGIPKSKL